MPFRSLRPRPAASRALLIIGALLLFGSLVFVWADRAFFITSGFTSRTTSALAQPAVQSRLAELLTDRVAEGRPRLEAARPVLVIATEAILGSSQFQNALEEAIELLHSQLFTEHDGRLLFRIRGLVDQLRAVLDAIAPDLAPELPALDTVEADIAGLRDARVRLLDLAEKIDVLSYVLPVLALLAFGLAVLLSNARKRSLMHVGIALAAVAVLTLVLLLAGRILLTESVRQPENVEAVKAVWATFTRPLRDLAWLTIALGTLLYFGARRTLESSEKTHSRIDTP